MKRLKIIQPKSCIVVETVELKDGTETIKKGSQLNCGACGGSLGVMKADLDFPFTLKDFKSRVENINFITGAFGFKCKASQCRAILFTDLTKLVFTTFENFKASQIKAFAEKQLNYKTTPEKIKGMGKIRPFNKI